MKSHVLLKPNMNIISLFVAYTDRSGFWADYPLTTDGDLNDLTLQMDFLFTKLGVLAAKILNAHVM